MISYHIISYRIINVQDVKEVYFQPSSILDVASVSTQSCMRSIETPSMCSLYLNIFCIYTHTKIKEFMYKEAKKSFKLVELHNVYLT